MSNSTPGWLRLTGDVLYWRGLADRRGGHPAGDTRAGVEGPATKLSCLPVSFFDPIARGEMALADWLRFAAELGLDGVECSPVLVEPRAPVSAAEFRRLAEANGLAVSTYTAYSDFTVPDPAAREQEVVAAVENARTARELGASAVRVLTGQAWPDVDRSQGIAWVVEAVRRVADAADRLGVRVVLENHTRAFVWTHFDFAMRSEVFLDVLEGLRDTSVLVQFDTANPLVAGEDALALFELVADRIGYVHVNDVARPGVFEFVPVGTGIAPVAEIFARLRQRGYDGWVGIEEASRTGRAGFRQAVEFVRQNW